MSGEEATRSIVAKCLLSTCDNLCLRAANVGQQTIWRKVRRQPRDQVDDSAHGNGEHNRVAAARSFNWIDNSSGDGSHPLGAGKHRLAIASDNLPAKTILPQRQPKRTPNQPGTDNRDLAKVKRLNH